MPPVEDTFLNHIKSLINNELFSPIKGAEFSRIFALSQDMFYMLMKTAANMLNYKDIQLEGLLT
jgi:hypothetical protein